MLVLYNMNHVPRKKTKIQRLTTFEEPAVWPSPGDTRKRQRNTSPTSPSFYSSTLLLRPHDSPPSTAVRTTSPVPAAYAMPHHHHTNPSHPPPARKLLSWRRVVAACAAVAALALLLAAAPATEDPSRWRSYLLGPLPGGTRKETVAAAVVAGRFAGPAASTSLPTEAPLSSFSEVGVGFSLFII
jgi:hypothetical protein